jgi:hypothetical protein
MPVNWALYVQIMALSEFEFRRAKKIVGDYIERRRPPVHIRPELDLGYRVSGQSIEMFEVRPVWRGEPGGRMEHPIAKATFVKSRSIWKVFWQRADLKWHSYQPCAEVTDLESFIKVVEKDEYCCFYG